PTPPKPAVHGRLPPPLPDVGEDTSGESELPVKRFGSFSEITSFLWSIADRLRGTYKQSDYGKVILPLTVLRRLDCVLKPTKQKVLNYLPKIESLKESAKDIALNKIAGFNFHNRSQCDFDKVVADPNNIAVNLTKYNNDYSN